MKDDTALILVAAGVGLYLLRDTAKPIGDTIQGVADTVGGVATASHGLGTGISNIGQDTGYSVGTVLRETAETYKAPLDTIQAGFDSITSWVKGLGTGSNPAIKAATRSTPLKLDPTPAQSAEYQGTLRTGYGSSFTMVNQALGLAPSKSLKTPVTSKYTSRVITATDRRVAASKKALK